MVKALQPGYGAAELRVDQARPADHEHTSQLAWTIAASCLAYALQVGGGGLHDEAIAPLTCAVVIAIATVISPRRRWLHGSGESFLTTMLLSAVSLQYGQLLIAPPGIYLSQMGPAGLQPFHFWILVAAGWTAVVAARPAWSGKYWPGVVLLAIYFRLGVWLIGSAPEPFIDTYVFQRDSVRALSAGSNPYELTFPNIYGDTSLYGPGLVVHGRVMFGFVYPPLNLLFAWLGSVVGGDVRYGQLVASTIAGACMLTAGWGHRLSLLATALFLFTPRGFLVIEQSWTEPYVVMLMALLILMARRAPSAVPYSAGLLLAVKQYMVLLVPLLWLLPGRPAGVRAMASFMLRAAASAAVVSLPLVFWNPRAFYDSVLALQFKQPFRGDALSYMAYWAKEGYGRLPHYVSFVAAAAACALSLWRSPRTAAGFAGGAACVYILFFAFAKQAFCNYYYFVVGTLCCAVAAATPHRGRIT